MPTVFDRLLAPVPPILAQLEQLRPKHGNETLTRFLDCPHAGSFLYPRRCGNFRNAWAVALANADPALHSVGSTAHDPSDKACIAFRPRWCRYALLRELPTSRDLLTNAELVFLTGAHAVVMAGVR